MDTAIFKNPGVRGDALTVVLIGMMKREFGASGFRCPIGMRPLAKSAPK